MQLGYYAEQHGEHYICVKGGTLVSEEEPHLAESYECNQEKGGDSLSFQEAEVVPAKRREEASAQTNPLYQWRSALLEMTASGWSITSTI